MNVQTGVILARAPLSRAEWQPPPDDVPGPGGPPELPPAPSQQPTPGPDEVPRGPNEVPQPRPPEV
jgi:hypothetical protein